MTANTHPLSSELLAALHDPDRAASTLQHVDECLACRIRLARIGRASGLATASDDSLERIVRASTPLPDATADLVSPSDDVAPRPNEIWRVGKSEALLVWVRQVFDDDVADVIPLVLDSDLADQDCVLVHADATPLASETAAMVSLRTHLHIGSFLNRVGVLDIRDEVAEVMTAIQEGRRPSGVPVGPPIGDDDDQRLEYRQALRDLLAELSPSAWLESRDHPAADVGQQPIDQADGRPSQDIDDIKSDLQERLPDVRCRDLRPLVVTVGEGVQATSTLKVVYLDAAVLVATLDDPTLTGFPEITAIAAVCRTMTLVEADVNAVAFAIPRDNWPALLLPTTHMRSAIENTHGVDVEPTATLVDFGLVDTLCKHLEGAMPAWEITERVGGHIGTADVHQIAARHASASIAQVTIEAGRAHQPAKKVGWADLPDGFGDQVANFVVAVANKHDVDDAVAKLVAETHDD
jgi:hypothetical protein